MRRDLNVKHYIGLDSEKGQLKAPGDYFRAEDTNKNYQVDSNGNAVEVGGSGGGVLTKLTYNFTPAELKTVVASPIEILAAQGAGTIIRVTSAVLRNQGGGVVYDFTGTPTLYLQGAGDYIATDADNTIDGGNAKVQSMVFGEQPLLDLEENAALIFGLTGGFPADATQGDDQIDLYITYELITL